MTVGTFDPDNEGSEQPKIPAWKKPKTELAKSAIGAIPSRKYFKDKPEKKRWDTIEQKSMGEDEASFLFRKWVEHKIAYVAKANAHTITRSFSNLLAQIENDDWRIEWIAKNRNRLLKERAESIPNASYVTLKVKDKDGSKQE